MVGDHFIFFRERFRLALLVFFRLFELLGEVALTIAMQLRIAFVDTELISDHLLIDLIVGAETQIHHTL
jgi:hypothetical protein